MSSREKSKAEQEFYDYHVKKAKSGRHTVISYTSESDTLHKFLKWYRGNNIGIRGLSNIEVIEMYTGNRGENFIPYIKEES